MTICPLAAKLFHAYSTVVVYQEVGML